MYILSLKGVNKVFKYNISYSKLTGIKYSTQWCNLSTFVEPEPKPETETKPKPEHEPESQPEPQPNPEPESET